ncbi:hypothetical protein K2173_002248 [Erythroxylum novogranatense]|uniref:Glycine-rich protein n=1 Tax=Erythroxylum novogranatense TaxID=1862640 RepID=A0AAV8TAX9_9ROSI|nr:hypothetical protein K2173_002248 [Erythroxylum novogranatense]
MSRENNTSKVFCFLLLCSVISLTTTLLEGVEARRFSGSRLAGDVGRDKPEGVARSFSINGEAKDSGPSPGVGHKYKDLQAIEDIKNSGPIRGNGHQNVSGKN